MYGSLSQVRGTTCHFVRYGSTSAVILGGRVRIIEVAGTSGTSWKARRSSLEKVQRQRARGGEEAD